MRLSRGIQQVLHTIEVYIVYKSKSSDGEKNGLETVKESKCATP
jgi:hypothetical protein